MVWAGEPEDGAVLVFAENCRAAKKIGFHIWPGCDDWIDIRVRQIRQHEDYLFSLGESNRLARVEAHGIESPPICEVCECWGAPPLAGRPGCENCGGYGVA